MESKVTTTETRVGKITLVTLTNDSGAWVTLSSLGGGVVNVCVPDNSGKLDDVVIGYTDPADYMADGPCAGKIPGRFANRIAKGHFTLDGVEHTLPVNNGPNHLHGGPDGFQNKIWMVDSVTDHSVRFFLESPDGEAGYPGNLKVAATYTWDNDNTLKLRLEADTDKATVVNLTNHSYFNLAGHDSGSVAQHKLKLYASHYLPTDETLIPTGEIAPVSGTPMDFTKPTAIGEHLADDFPALKYGKGYDNCWVVDNYKKGVEQKVAELTEATSGRVLEISTTQPAAQVYTGNWLNGCPSGKGGNVYHDYDAVAIECQNFPDAPNHPNFPTPVLRPGEHFDETISFHFTTTSKA